MPRLEEKRETASEILASRLHVPQSTPQSDVPMAAGLSGTRRKNRIRVGETPDAWFLSEAYDGDGCARFPSNSHVTELRRSR